MKVGDKLYSIGYVYLAVYEVTRVCPQTIFARREGEAFGREVRVMRKNLDKRSAFHGYYTFNFDKAVAEVEKRVIANLEDALNRKAAFEAQVEQLRLNMLPKVAASA